MTLAEILPTVQQLPAADKLTLIRLLAEDLDARGDISPLAPDRAYSLPTPYGMVGAGRILADAMKSAEDAGR
jgi:hypothetical protein